MKLRYILLFAALMLAQAGAAHASSNAAVQAGRVSVEGSMYGDGYLGVTAEIGLTGNTAVSFGNEDRVPSVKLKWQLRENDKKSDVAINAGIVSLGEPGLTLGVVWHYKLAPTTKLFADLALDSSGGYAFTNAGVGLSLNISKQVALTGQLRSLDGWGTLGLGIRATF